MEYIDILGGSISRADEKNFDVDYDHSDEVNAVIDLIVETLKAAGYDINLVYRMSQDGYTGKK